MRVAVYTFAWNESRLVPYFLRHYLPWVDRIVVYDHRSTDGTPEMLAQYGPRVEVRPFDAPSYPEPEPLGHLRRTCWHESRGVHDWAVVVDFDEFLHHPLGVLTYLSRVYAEGHTFVQTYGWQMVSEEFPPPHVALTSAVRNGVPHHWYHKPVVFRPEQFSDIVWLPGCHDVAATGNFRLLRSGSLSLLHYKNLGYDYLRARNAAYRSRMQDVAQLKTLGHYIDRGDAEERQQFDDLLARAVEVV